MVALAAGAGGYLLVDRSSSPGPSAATHTPTPLPVSSTPSGGGEPPIQAGVDCSGGSPPDAYTAAAVKDICDVLVPLAAMDPACTGTPGAACESAAGELDRVASAALADIRDHHPATAAEVAADPHLRTAFRDYATAGTDLATGVADGEPRPGGQGGIRAHRRHRRAEHRGRRPRRLSSAAPAPDHPGEPARVRPHRHLEIGPAEQ